MPTSWGTFFSGQRACVSPHAGPTPLGRSCFSSAHNHLTSREAGSEIWIYEDLWNVGKEECRFSEDSRGFSHSRSAISVMGRGLFPLARHHQVVLHGKHPGHAVGANSRQVLVGLVVYNAFQRYVSVVHDDTDRAVGANAIVLQRPVAVDGDEQVAAQTVVIA